MTRYTAPNVTREVHMSDDVPSLQEIAERTIAQYAGRVESFWEGTRDHDVSQTGRLCCAALATTALAAF